MSTINYSFGMHASLARAHKIDRWFYLQRATHHCQFKFVIDALAVWPQIY